MKCLINFGEESVAAILAATGFSKVPISFLKSSSRSSIRFSSPTSWRRSSRSCLERRSFSSAGVSSWGEWVLNYFVHL